MSETEKLIELVKERPYLYDMNDPEYKNRAKRLATWKEITEEMGSGHADIWLARWKGLKDNYVKYKKSTEPAHADTYKNYKNWPWAEHLMFLDDYFTSRRMPKYKPKPREETQVPSIVEYIIPHEHTTKDESEDSSKETEEQESTDEEQDDQKLDGVDHFFLSYAQSFKKLPVRMQIMLKLDIATLFSRYELQADGVTPESIDNIPRVVPHPVKTEFDFSFNIDD
ncbi:hypothetical protein PYW07_002677 [Mythimna separata]|uniref:MADF domain-containing protein n=1 Tax=Mythimna separata TaxID=271217 RepID=A0AAD7YG48_MYTSE|nr:hypothetical protein PYW07_002677 [Mythimna separata]